MDVLTIVRLAGDMVRVLHEGKPVADVPGRDLTEHLAPSRFRLWPRRRRWRDLSIDVTPSGRAVIRIGDRVGANTLTPDELHRLRTLVGTPSTPPSERPGRVPRLP